MREKPRKRSQFQMTWRRYKKSKLAILGLAAVAVLFFSALIIPLFKDYDTAVEQDFSSRYQPLSAEHIFGTDQFGRDIFIRMMFGARISLLVGIATVSASLLSGSCIGAVAGYYGGRIDEVLMRIMDVFLAIPNTLLAISIVAALGQGITNLLIALAISQVPSFARVVRASILTVKEQDYIEAARALGTPSARIIARHILPNAIGPIIVQTTLNVARTILNISSLSFVGLGISPPTPEWGSMLADAKPQMLQYPHLILIPGAAIAITVMAINLVGDGLRDALDPRLRN
ncbi:MAG: ABC transporter permease [Synergistaceae bacterium]|jgi:peptide/nickel transport system permease protein|nr:ABC transporter permease [Synergistaceae bacterium]